MTQQVFAIKSWLNDNERGSLGWVHNFFFIFLREGAKNQTNAYLAVLFNILFV